MAAMVLAPICPHTLTNRPVVLPASSHLALRMVTPAPNVVLTIDGQWGLQITDQDRIEIHEAAHPLLLHRPPHNTFFDILREKLHWGVRVG